MDSVYQSPVDPLRANNSHSFALQLIGRNKRVLEVGAAGGHVAKAIKAQDNYVVAIERDARLKDSLQGIADEVIVTDLDWLDLRSKCGEKKFDVILAGDVLEHCLHPDLVVLQFHHLLHPDGCVILSIPNIAHGDVRLALLRGRFDYQETGLLDHTHIRFFTRDTLTEFISRNGFQIEQTFATTAELGTTEFGPVSSDVPSEAINYVRSDPNSNIYQFVVKAVPAATFIHEQKISDKSDVQVTTTDHLLAQVSQYQTLAASRGFQLQDYEQTKISLDQSRDEIARLSVEVDLLKSRHESLTTTKNRLALDLLDSKDLIIGLAAQRDELKYRLERQQLNHQRHLDEIYSSQTWKIGRLTTFPLRVLKKLLRRP